MATEVGDAKSEIVFHGDVMNTTARIQGLCADLGQSLLISRELLHRLPGVDDFLLEPLGAHRLKGREQPLELYGVRRKREEA